VRRVIALVVVAIATLGASCDRPPAHVGPGEVTQSSPFLWRHRCQTDCRGCTADERRTFEQLRGYYCQEPAR